MNYKELAHKILQNIGGKKNIVSLTHCSTRIRLTLQDQKLLDVSELENTDGIIKIINGEQAQIVIGNDVVAVYDELKKEADTITANEKNETSKKFSLKKIGGIIIDFMMSIFYPLIPAMAGAGMLKSILVILGMLKWVDPTSQSFIILGYISDALFYFMPLLIAFTAAEKLKSDKFITVTVSSFLLLPKFIALLGEGTSIFGISIPNIAYGNLIFPAILVALLCSIVEKIATRFVPKILRIIFVPMIVFLVTIPMTLVILGPLGYYIGNYLAAFLLWFQRYFGFLSVTLLSAVLPLLVATGMHKSFNPIALNNFATLGYEPFYTLATLAHNVAETGGSLAVAIKSKNVKTKSIALSGSISASLGITEPALYGVTLVNKSVLYSVMIGSGLSGAYLAMMQVKDWVLGVTPSVFTFSAFAEEGNPSNMINAIIGLVIAFATTFVLTFIFYKEEVKTEENNKTEAVKLSSPAKGTIIKLEEVNDETFASKTLGDGFAIVPEDGNIYAPIAGEVVMTQPSKHAIGIKSPNGMEVLIHIGVDTVILEGKYFDNYVEVGSEVSQGQLIASFDYASLTAQKFDLTTCVIITNSDTFKTDEIKLGKHDNGEDVQLVSHLI